MNNKTSPSKAKNPRLYNSNLSLSRSFTQYDFHRNRNTKSMDGLDRWPTSITHRSIRKREMPRKVKAYDRLPLILPKLEPDVNLDLDVETRDESAHYKASPEKDVTLENGLDSDFEVERPESEDNDDAYFNFDDDTPTAKKKLETLGKFEMEHNWILQEDLRQKHEDMLTHSKKVRISLPDEDPMSTIQNRIEELQTMAKPRAEFANYIAKLSPEQREKIEKITNMDVATLRKQKRAKWDAIEKFRHAYCILCIIIRACKPRRRYYKDDKPDTAISLKRLRKKDQSKNKDSDRSRSSLSLEMELALSVYSDFRTEDDIKKRTEDGPGLSSAICIFKNFIYFQWNSFLGTLRVIREQAIWVLRATKAFKHLFPAESEKELAKVVAYERYDANRILACQGREPERFYYILTGRVQKVREYRLSSGHISRSEGYIEKGTTTDPEELEMSWQREHHFVARGQTEVLILDRDDFLRLQNKSQGPPVDFISKLELFHEFPCEVFRTNPEYIQLKYYGQDVVISKDTNRTPWLHIVKSGKVRVVRIQYVTDVENESKFTKQTTEELGCGRAFSHANAMLGTLISQRKMKALSNNNVSLPEISGNNDVVQYDSSLSHNLGLNINIQNPPTRRFSVFTEGLGILANLTKRHKAVPVPVQNNTLPNVMENETNEKEETSSTEEPTKPKNQKRKPKLVKPPIIVEQGTDNPSRSGSRMDIPNEYEEDNQQTKMNGGWKTERPALTLPRITPVDNDTSDVLHPHGTYMTREQTEFDPVYARKLSQMCSASPIKKEAPQRKACLQLDLLCPGDIFGLDDISRKFRSLQSSQKKEGLEHLEKPGHSEPQGVSLVSDGAEVIRISKRFFLQHAQNNTMLRVETMQREYMSPDEAKNILYTKETWNQYKSVLMRRTVNGIETQS